VVHAHSGLASLNSANARGSGHSVTVSTVSLDGYFDTERIDAIKIDAQGAEMAIAAGAIRLIERDRPIVFTELWLAGLQNMGSDPRWFLGIFDERGYRIATTDHP